MTIAEEIPAETFSPELFCLVLFSNVNLNINLTIYHEAK